MRSAVAKGVFFRDQINPSATADGTDLQLNATAQYSNPQNALGPKLLQNVRRLGWALRAFRSFVSYRRIS